MSEQLFVNAVTAGRVHKITISTLNPKNLEVASAKIKKLMGSDPVILEVTKVSTTVTIPYTNPFYSRQLVRIPFVVSVC